MNVFVPFSIDATLIYNTPICVFAKPSVLLLI